MSGDAQSFNNIGRRGAVKFFPTMQGFEENSRHFERKITGTCTIESHRQKLGGPG
jgi:hypothetical protein